jgi:transposase
VHRFNAAGPSGLIDRNAPGAAPRLSGEQEAELASLVDTGPDLETDGVVRWRCIDLKALIRRRFGVDYHELY